MKNPTLLVKRVLSALGASVALALATSGLAAVPAEAGTSSISLHDGRGEVLYANAKTIFWGKAKVSEPSKRVVRVQRQSGRQWVTVATVKVGKSHASWNWKATVTVPSKTGKYRYRSRLYSSGSSKAKVLRTSKTKTVTVKAAPRRYQAYIDSGGPNTSTWQFLDMNGDGILDAVGNDADRDGTVEDFYWNVRGGSHYDLRAWDTNGDRALDSMWLDRNSDGWFDLWVWDTDGRPGYDHWWLDSDFDHSWDAQYQPGSPQNSGAAIGMLAQFGQSLKGYGYVEPCAQQPICLRNGV